MIKISEELLGMWDGVYVCGGGCVCAHAHSRCQFKPSVKQKYSDSMEYTSCIKANPCSSGL